MGVSFMESCRDQPAHRSGRRPATPAWHDSLETGWRICFTLGDNIISAEAIWDAHSIVKKRSAGGADIVIKTGARWQIRRYS